MTTPRYLAIITDGECSHGSGFAVINAESNLDDVLHDLLCGRMKSMNSHPAMQDMITASCRAM